MSEAIEESAEARRAQELETRRRLGTAFGWVAGASLGLLVNFGIFIAVGEGYPATVTTFVAVLVGAFGGMAVADRLGDRAFRGLGVVAGVLLAVIVSVVAWYFLRAA